jgi:glycosyltransferase involved in cell wall biosynthesis
MTSRPSLRILLIHQNLPAQYRNLINALTGTGKAELLGIREEAPHAPSPPNGCAWLQYSAPKDAPTGTHPYLRRFEAGIRRGQVIARIGQELKKRGYRPDLILGHPGWGEDLFLKDVFPDSRLVSYIEFYYHAQGADVGFDPEFPSRADDALRLRVWNSMLLHDLAACDQGLVPTRWQTRQIPQIFHSKLQILHDGIRTEQILPDPGARFRLPDGRILERGAPVVTFVSRNLEPYRGFHVFMRALPKLLRLNPDAIVVIVGGDGVGYGQRPAEPDRNWREKLMRELQGQFDTHRVHFLGRLPYGDYLRLLQVSALHVYLTYPFVLSWSLMEAMACGCPILASRTPPVEEMITDGVQGMLCDFFDHDALAEKAAEMLGQADELNPLRDNARRAMVEHYDFETVIKPKLLAFLGVDG